MYYTGVCGLRNKIEAGVGYELDEILKEADRFFETSKP